MIWKDIFFKRSVWSINNLNEENIPSITRGLPDMYVLSKCSVVRKQPIRNARPNTGRFLSFRSQFRASRNVRHGV